MQHASSDEFPTPVAFVGWAGPRGLASIVYAVIVVDTVAMTGSGEVFTIAATTILLSTALHGVSAAPLSARYGKWMAAVSGPRSTERLHVPHLPLRSRSWEPPEHT